MAQVTKQVPAAGSGVNKTTEVYTSPKDGTLQGVTYTPVSTIVGSDTNTRTIGLVNIGPVSNPKYTPMATLPLTSSVTLPGGQPSNIPLTLDVTIKKDDRLVWASVANGNGVADPGGDVTATFQLI